jgi:hypothetical protein
VGECRQQPAPAAIALQHGGALNDLTEVVISFVGAHVRSVDELHLLLAMAAAPDRWFDAERVAGELAIAAKSARNMLEHLASHNLLEIRVTADVRYQFHPGTPQLLTAANDCIEACRRNPMALWRLLSGRLDHRGIRDFADAFRIRPDDDR